MPKESSGKHTPASIEHVALRLEAIVAQLRAAKVLMELPPEIAEVEVPREASRELGLMRLGAWADSVRDAVSDARLKQLRNGHSVTVSESDTKRKKAR